MILLATRPLRDGEELHLNYRLRPEARGSLPWYTPVDEEEDAERWAPLDETWSAPRPS